MKVKEPTPELRRKGVVYEVPCSECDHVYVHWGNRQDTRETPDRTQDRNEKE